MYEKFGIPNIRDVPAREECSARCDWECRTHEFRLITTLAACVKPKKQKIYLHRRIRRGCLTDRASAAGATPAGAAASGWGSGHEQAHKWNVFPTWLSRPAAASAS